MRIKYYILAFVSFIQIASAQEAAQKKIDSIQRALVSLNGKARVDALNQIAQIYYSKLEDNDKSLQYAEDALAISRKTDYKNGIAQSCVCKGGIKKDLGFYDEAAKLFGEGLMTLNRAKRNSAGKYDQIILPIADPEVAPIVAELYTGLAATYRGKMNLSKAVQYYIEALKVYETNLDTLISGFITIMRSHGEKVDRNNFTVKVAIDYLKKNPNDKEAKANANKGGDMLGGIRWTCLALGELFQKIKDYNQALLYLKKAERNAAEVNSRESHLQILASIGKVFLKKNEYDSSVVYFKKACVKANELEIVQALVESYTQLGLAYMEKKDYTSALSAYEKVNEFLQPLSDGSYKTKKMYASFPQHLVSGLVFNFRTAINLRLIGDIHTKAGHDDLAKKSYRNAIVFLEPVLTRKEKDRDTFMIARVRWSLGNLYSKTGDHAKAGKQFELVSALYEDKFQAEEKLSFFDDAIGAYERKGDKGRAYDYYKKYIHLRDSVYGQKNTNEIAEIQKRFEVEKKDADIELLEKSQEAKEVEIEKQKLVRNGFIGGSIILLILAFVIFRSLQQNKKAKKIIEEQKQLVDEKNKDILDSIHYARRIQRAHLPTGEYLAKNLKRLMK